MSDSIQCSTCKEHKPSSMFYAKRGGRLGKGTQCKPCHSAYIKARWQKTKDRAIEYLGGKCIDCKRIYPRAVYDFHHRDPKTKRWVWNTMKKRPWRDIQEELDKCDLLCANCHRIRHDNNT